MGDKNKVNLVSGLGLVVLLLLALVASACTNQASQPATAPKTSEAPKVAEASKKTTEPAKTAEAKRLTIGAILPLSGPISTVGLALGRGFEMYFNKVNEQGGVKIGADRYLINFKLEDGKGDAEAAGTAANKLVNEDGAKFVYGEVLENATSAIYQVTAPKKVLHLISWINIPRHPADVSQNKPLLVRPVISPNDSQAPLLDYLVKAYPNAKTIAVSAPRAFMRRSPSSNAARVKPLCR